VSASGKSLCWMSCLCLTETETETRRIFYCYCSASLGYFSMLQKSAGKQCTEMYNNSNMN